MIRAMRAPRTLSSSWRSAIRPHHGYEMAMALHSEAETKGTTMRFLPIHRHAEMGLPPAPEDTSRMGMLIDNGPRPAIRSERTGVLAERERYEGATRWGGVDRDKRSVRRDDRDGRRLRPAAGEVPRRRQSNYSRSF